MNTAEMLPCLYTDLIKTKMTLQLYLNGSLFNEMHLPEEDFNTDEDMSWEENVRFRQQALEGHVYEMKGLFWRQLARARSWDLVLNCESKINKRALVNDDTAE